MKKKNFLKIAALTAVFALAGMFANAQTNPTPVPAVKLIDNKGTIKYLQSTNGVTTITATAPDGTGVLHTWKLGGTLIENTYIGVDGHIFGLNGLVLQTGDASTSATSGTSGDPSAVPGSAGWTLLVRDEATGAINKMMVTDMVQSGWSAYQLTSDLVTDPEFTIPGIGLASFETIYIYRNGAKLVAGIDYIIDLDNNKITLIPAGTGTGATPANTWTADAFTLYVGDKIEIHFIK